MKESKLKKIIKQFLLIIFYFLFSIIFVLIPSFRNDMESSNIILFNLSNICSYIILLTVFIILFKKVIVPDFYDFKKNGKKYLKNNYEYYIYGLLWMIISNIILSIFIGVPENEEAVQELFNTAFIYYLTVALIVAPITEELLTRVILKDAFKHEKIYFLLSGFIFGLLHVLSPLIEGNILQLFFIIPYGSLGYYLAKIYKNTNNVWSNIFFHFLHNFIATILSLLVGGII